MVQKDRKATIGLKNTARPEIKPMAFLAHSSDFCCAILFGTNSPKINVKKEMTTVIRMTARVFKREIEPGHPIFLSQATRCSERTSAEKAAPKNPARVMPIWIVERKPDWFSTMYKSFFAFLSPSSASFLSWIVLRDITAISVPAKKALTRIRRIWRMIVDCTVMLPLLFLFLR